MVIKFLKKKLSSEQISKIKKDMMIMPYVYDPVKNQQNKDKNLIYYKKIT